jgi:hypothetical protein
MRTKNPPPPKSAVMKTYGYGKKEIKNKEKKGIIDAYYMSYI